MRGVSELEERFKRQARNEALFREVNERIAQLGEAAQAWSPDGGVEFMCECGVEGGCGERVRVPLGKRNRPDLAAPGRTQPERVCVARRENGIHRTDYGKRRGPD